MYLNTWLTRCLFIMVGCYSLHLYTRLFTFWFIASNPRYVSFDLSLRLGWRNASHILTIRNSRDYECEWNAFFCASSYLNHWVIGLPGSTGFLIIVPCKKVGVQTLLPLLNFVVLNIFGECHYYYLEFSF